MVGEQQIKKAYESILDNDFEKAIAWFEEAIVLEPDNAEYHYKLSITFARSNRLSKALSHARNAARLAPEQAAYTFHLQHLQAVELMERAEKHFDGRQEKLFMAVTLLKQAVALDPLAIEGFLLLGLAYARLADFPQAIQAVREVLKLDPQHEQARLLLIDLQKNVSQYMKTNSSSREGDQ